MIKKVIICLLVFAFLSSVIPPKFALAMGTSSISVETALVISAVTLVVLFGIPYLIKKTKTEKNEKEADLIIKAIKKNISPSGELIVLRW